MTFPKLWQSGFSCFIFVFLIASECLALLILLHAAFLSEAVLLWEVVTVGRKNRPWGEGEEGKEEVRENKLGKRRDHS